MHDLMTICPAYTMKNGKGNFCDKCINGDFKNCIKNKCIKNSYFLSFLSYCEASFIKRKNFYNKVDAYICPSQFYYNLMKKSRFTKSNIYFKRNLLKTSQEYSLTTKKCGYFLYFGRLSKEKGVMKLLKAVAACNNVSLIIAGTGQCFNEIKDFIVSNFLNNRVNLVGFKSGNELQEIIKNSKCVILPSEWYENAPYSAMEAMALGKPLIVSNYGGLPELVANGKNGFVFNDLKTLTDCINKLNNLDYDTYFSMCKNSMEIAQEQFNPISYVDFLLEVYNDIKEKHKMF